MHDAHHPLPADRSADATPAGLASGVDNPVTCCHECGTLQRLPRLAGWTTAVCAVCQTVIERSSGRSLSAALACSSAALVLLVPANYFPFLTTSILGVSRQSRLHSSASAMFGNGWPDLGLVIALFVIVFPVIRFGLLTAVLGTLQFSSRRPRWLGRAFRYTIRLEAWSMPDVFVLALAVAYGKLVSQLSVEVGIGAMCFIGVALLALFVRATLDPGDVWRAIGLPSQNAVQARPGHTQPALSCVVCELAAAPTRHEGDACARCAATLHPRKPNAVGRSIALAVAAMLLYVPANIYPMASIPNGLSTQKYTVVGGVIELWQSDLYSLALLVVVASVLIPVFKLIGLIWCLTSVLQRSTRHLVGKTRIFLMVEEIGRWSMVDPFVIACFVPVSQFNALVYGRADSAAPAFTAVVILTVFAARAFDPRLLWDAARDAARGDTREGR